MDDEAIERNTLLLVQKQLSFGDAHVVVESASDSLIPKFLPVTLDTFWRGRIDLCMHGLVQPQTLLPIFRSVFVYTSCRGCLKHGIDDAMVTVDFHMLF